MSSGEFLEIASSIVLVIESAVELSLVGAVEDFAEVGTGLDIEFDQVAA